MSIYRFDSENLPETSIKTAVVAAIGLILVGTNQFTGPDLSGTGWAWVVIGSIGLVYCRFLTWIRYRRQRNRHVSNADKLMGGTLLAVFILFIIRIESKIGIWTLLYDVVDGILVYAPDYYWLIWGSLAIVFAYVFRHCKKEQRRYQNQSS